MSWQHIKSDALDWVYHSDGIRRRELLVGDTAVNEFRLDPGAHLGFAGLGLLKSGSGRLANHSVSEGTLFWSQQDNSLRASEAGLELYQLQPAPGVAPASALEVIGRDDVPWENFPDPAGRPTQPVQVLLEGQLSVLRTRFEPSYVAGEHWHDFNTYYFITSGDMQFGHEGQYYEGDIRHVEGGYSYGPEKPGPNGVEFVLVSSGGPVNLHWADLESAPNGAL